MRVDVIIPALDRPWASLPDGTRGSALIALHVALLAASGVATVSFTPTEQATRWVLGTAVVAYSAAALSAPFTQRPCR